MTDKDESESLDHLQKATESTQLGVIGLRLGIYHSIFGFSEWVKDRHIVIQTGITAIITVGLVLIGNEIGHFFFTTFWEQAVYASGLRLRLLPIPLSLVIYALILALVLLSFSLDSDIRQLQTELDEIKQELDKRENEPLNPE